MAKKEFKGSVLMGPLPPVMVSCGKEKNNIITIAWTGIVNSDPPMTYISVRKSRFSHGIISEEKEFVINLTTEDLTFAADWCGVKSGRDFDKFKEMKLTPQKCSKVECPMIAEAPINLECKVKEVHSYPSHDMFVAEIVNVNVSEEFIDGNGRIRMDRAGLVCYNHGEYFTTGSRPLGKFGYSVMKKSTKKRLNRQKNSGRNFSRKKKNNSRQK